MKKFVQQVEFEYDDNGALVRETWRHANVLHRVGAPALLMFAANGELIAEGWFEFGLETRRDGARSSFETSPSTGVVYLETWMQNGKLHREQDLPAEILRSPNTGKVTSLSWYMDGRLHRADDMPAQVFFREDGTLDQANYYKNGTRYRDHGPAVVEYREDGVTPILSTYYPTIPSPGMK